MDDGLWSGMWPGSYQEMSYPLPFPHTNLQTCMQARNVLMDVILCAFQKGSTKTIFSVQKQTFPYQSIDLSAENAGAID